MINYLRQGGYIFGSVGWLVFVKGTVPGVGVGASRRFWVGVVKMSYGQFDIHK